MKEIIYLTRNAAKFQVAQKAVQGLGIALVRQDLETPEIQSADVVEIASFSARWASERLGKPVAVTDGGYYIEALNGFPGPFIKYINSWLTATDILNLMKDKKNRNVEVRSCLAYCAPGRDPVTFVESFKGTIALEKGPKGATPINEIFIPDGFTEPESAITPEKMVHFWSSGDAWQKLAAHLDKTHD